MPLPLRYRYEISKNGVFLGVLDPSKITSPFQLVENINSAGAQLVIKYNIDADVARQSVQAILDETGDPILDETGDPILEERRVDVVGNSNPNILIANDNDIVVYEFSDYHPNGVVLFSGYISKWNATFGSGGGVTITCLNQSQDLNNYLIPGSTVDNVDQQNTTVDIPSGGWLLAESADGKLPQRDGQTFTVGTGIHNISKIKLKLDTQRVQVITVLLWTNISEAGYDTGASPIGTAQATVDPANGIADYDFIFPTPISVTPGHQYFFEARAAPDSGPTLPNTQAGIYSSITDVYSGGTFYATRSVNASGWHAGDGSLDLYFKTYYSDNSTARTYTNRDPSSYILDDIMTAYIASGGRIAKQPGGYTASGVSAYYTFKLNTTLTGIQKVGTMLPANWYYYVDPAANYLVCKAAATTAEHTFVKGVHIGELNVEATKEHIANIAYVSGGPNAVGSPINIFTKVTSQTSLVTDRVGLALLSDTRVQGTDGLSTAQLIGQNYLDQNDSEAYSTVVQILHGTYDLSLIKIGHMVKLAGYGNFVDSLLLQVVSKSRSPFGLILTLGTVAKRSSQSFEDLQQKLSDIQTLDNPNTPS